MKLKRFFAFSLITALAAATFLLVSALAEGTTVVVTPTDQQGWSTADTRPGGTVNFVADSTAPGGGHGALELKTDGTNEAKAQYMHQTTTALADVTELSYWTKQVSSSFAQGDPSYQLPVCLGGFNSPITPLNPTGCTGFTTLVFEPYQMNGSDPVTQTVINGQWQQWDVDAGKFWSSRSYTDGTCSVTAGAGGPPFYSLSTLQTNCPNAVVVGFGVNVGTFNPNYDVYADLVDFNGTTYDFEPYLVASNKDQCKSGGYNVVKRADGTSFKNQGDCVQYVNTGK